MYEYFTELKIEQMDDGDIVLTQVNCGEEQVVAIHPVHLKFMAEKFGLVEASDPQTARTIARLSRQLLALNERIQHIDYWLTNHSDHKHADLSYERTYAEATADIAREFCAELADDANQREVVSEAPPLEVTHPVQGSPTHSGSATPTAGKQPAESQQKLI